MNAFYKIDDLAIHVVDLHPEQETALVFLHGRCLSVKMWERQLGCGELAGYRLVAFDLPGHGLSEHSNDPMASYSMQGFIQVLNGLISRLHIARFVLVGCSLGGHVALEAQPGLPGCIGVFAMTMPITKPMDFAMMYFRGELMSRVFVEQPAPDEVSAYARILLRPGAPEYPEFLEDDFYKADPRVHAGIVQSVIKGEYDDETEIIRHCSVPVAVVLGSEEQIHDLSYLDTLSLTVWRERAIMIPAGGHLAGWENPEAVNQLLAAFANGCSGISPACR